MLSGCDFSCKINSMSNFRESVDFQKKCLNLTSNAKHCSMDLGRTFSVSNFL